LTEEGRGVDDGIPLPGPRQSLCWRKGARWEVSHRLCREDCHRQSEYWLLVPISKKNHHPTKVGLDPNPPPQQPAVVVASNPATLMHNKKPHTLAGTGLICCSRVDDGILPAPCGPSGFPGRGVCPAQGRLMPPAFAAHSNLRLSWIRILPR